MVAVDEGSAGEIFRYTTRLPLRGGQGGFPGADTMCVHPGLGMLGMEGSVDIRGTSSKPNRL